MTSCVQALTDDRAVRYLRDALPEAERDAFEVHVLECDECSDLLEAARVARDVLEEKAPARRARPWPLVQVAGLAAGVAAAAAGAFVLLRPAPVPPASPRASVAPLPAPPATIAAQELATLGEVDPPVYVPLTMRSSAARDEAFDRAMGHYARREYAAAAEGLRVVVRDRPNRGDAWLFLGVSELMAGDDEKARASLRHAAQLDQPPYSDAAPFFLGKAELRRGALDAARQAFGDVSGSYQPEARRLWDRLDRLGTKRP